MSWAPSIGVVGASYWSYMASVLANTLGLAIKERKVNPSLLPEGVYRDAKEFFNRAVGESGGEQRTPARMNAYVVAVDAVWDSAHSVRTSEEVQNLLRDYSSLLTRFREAGPLSEAELKTAEQLRQFFISLSQAGDADAYVDHVRFDPPPIDMVR
jgi:hypothetical protein